MKHDKIDLIRIKTFTEYFGKKEAINKAIDFFKKNPEKYFVCVNVNWHHQITEVKGEEEIIIRREVINHALGFDFVRMTSNDYDKLYPNNKDEFINLWNGLKYQQPKEEEND